MPTIYTRGPAKVTVTERGGGGWGLLVVLILVLAVGGTVVAIIREVLSVVREVLTVVLSVLAGAVVLAIAGTAVVAVRRYRQRHQVGQNVHVITDTAWPNLPAHAAQGELPASSPWADEQWVGDVRAQEWSGIPREWSEPPESWPDEWRQWR